MNRLVTTHTARVILLIASCFAVAAPSAGAESPDGFWQLLSPTTTQDRAGEIQSAHDSFHAYGDDGGSELAIPWHTLYGLGEGVVPTGAQVSLVYLDDAGRDYRQLLQKFLLGAIKTLEARRWR